MEGKLAQRIEGLEYPLPSEQPDRDAWAAAGQSQRSRRGLSCS